jgi:alkylation response protein AidB-like acyl-CoA dehydrogenase
VDFAFTEDQESLRAIAQQILETEVTQDRLKEVEGGPDFFDERTWQQLAQANLLGLTVPAEHGGSGFGLVESCIVLEQAGRTVAPVPLLPALIGALAIGTFGTDEQQASILPEVATGDTILALALIEPGNDDADAPNTVATRDGSGWRLEGTKTFVAAAHLAGLVLVPAKSETGTIIGLVDPSAGGIEMIRQVTASGEPVFDLVFSGARVERALEGPDIGRWLIERAVVGLCAVEVGVVDRAIEMTAAYSSGRVQFDRPLGSFQAVQQRAADAFIDVLAMRWTMWNAAWRLDTGLEAGEDVTVAKFWAADGGHRVVSAAQHLHGGIGVDLSYPLHRYFYRSKQIEVTLGTATRQLVKLGRVLAAASDGA